MTEQEYMSYDNIRHVLDQFCLDSEPLSWKLFGSGHINRTVLLQTKSGKKYVLQRISEELTKEPDRMMENISGVLAHIAKKEPDPRKRLTLVPAKNGTMLFWDESGAWRIYHYLEDSFCLQAPRSDDDFYRAALAFGHFEELLRDYPADLLTETLPGFHNTPGRYRQFHNALDKDCMDRCKNALPEIEFVLEREAGAGRLQKMQDAGEMPVRVTHNDTKLNNVMFDEKTGEALCVVDLDTVMPGLSVNDFGDAIRFGASTAAEDERDLSKVTLSIDRYRAFSKGFLEACPNLDPVETEYFPEGARIMTLEVGLRFLTDYLEGDRYFHIGYEDHNLIRCRTQFKLVTEIEQKWDLLHITKL